MIKESIYKNTQLKPYYIFFRKWGVNKEVYLDEILDILLEGDNSGEDIAKHFNRSKQSFNRAIKKLFPTKRLNGGNETWYRYFLSLSDYDRCTYCKSTKPKAEFVERSRCKDCHKVSSALYRARKANAIPPWANLERIREIYNNCPVGYHVDHIIPLKGCNVCGLHVESNLQYLPAEDNLKKCNKFMG